MLISDDLNVRNFLNISRIAIKFPHVLASIIVIILDILLLTIRCIKSLLGISFVKHTPSDELAKIIHWSLLVLIEMFIQYQ